MRNLIVAVMLLVTSGIQAQVNNPVPEPIQPSGLVIKLQDFATITPSSTAFPRAKINMLREAPDGSGRLFVNDLRGKFWVLIDAVPTLYTDLKVEFPALISTPGFGTGFGAFAFHPEFSSNGLFYTSHAEPTGSAPADYIPAEYDQITMQWVLSEWQATDPAANIFEGTKREILRFDYPSQVHGIQEIAFNPNATTGEEDYGLLYVCLGDGGSSINFLNENIQTTHSFLGTIFRINPLGNNSQNGEYGIPSNNPFADSTGTVVKEIYAYGFRNPHRISWDTEGDHKMLEGDIGEKSLEEINLILPGHNYGWDQREGTFLFDRTLGQDIVFDLPADDSTNHFTYPVAQYDHDEGIAVIGGFVYRGSVHPELYGQYLFGDIASGRIFHVPVADLELGSQAVIAEVEILDAEGFATTLLEEVNHSRADLRFGLDSEGEIYVLTKTDGVIRKVVHPSTVPVATTTIEQEVAWLSPNPGNGWYYFTAKNNSTGNVHMTVVDVQGKIVFQQYFSVLPESINLTHLPTGTYWVNWKVQEQTLMQKIQIIK